MKASIIASLLFNQLHLFGMAAACATEPYSANNLPASPGRPASADGLLVKFKSYINQQQARRIAQSYLAREVLPLSTPQQANTQMVQWHHLKFAPDIKLQQITQRIAWDTNIESVELNARATIQNQSIH